MSPDVELTVDWQVADEIFPEAEAELGSLLVHALRREGQAGSWEMAIRFVDDDTIASAHERYLGDPSPTDIMTFPYDEDDGVKGGDILISVDTARFNAVEHDWTVAGELRFLVLHGLLHILGWDDRTETDRSRMLGRQRELLDSWLRARAD